MSSSCCCELTLSTWLWTIWSYDCNKLMIRDDRVRVRWVEDNLTVRRQTFETQICCWVFKEYSFWVTHTLSKHMFRPSAYTKSKEVSQDKFWTLVEGLPQLMLSPKAWHLFEVFTNILTIRFWTLGVGFSSANTQHKDDTVCKLIHRSLLVCMTTCEMIIIEIMM